MLDRNVESVDEAVFSVPCDITDTAQVEAAIAAVVEHFGALDIVINNAGIGAEGDIAANDDDEWAPGARRERGRSRPGEPGRAAAPPRVAARGDRQHLLGRRRDRHPQSGALLGQQGRGRGRSPSPWPPTMSAKASG